LRAAFRHERIVVELERPTGAGEIIQLAARNGLLDFPFGEQLKEKHALF
jgi:hypothetical protein